MNFTITKRAVHSHSKKPPVMSLVFAVVLAGFSVTSHADKITSISSAAVPGVQDGFGGLNFENINVVLDGDPISTFDTLTGAYSFAPGSDFSYESRVFTDNGKTTQTGTVLAKDWPVGEPAGIKIVNDDADVRAPKPPNCIMSTSYLEGHFLDDPDPQMVVCSSAFQGHKRYKLAMMPATVAGGAGFETPIDLVYNTEAEAGSRSYQVYQKINNWTDVRLKGFTIQVGIGTGASFVPAADVAAGVGVANLSLSVPGDIWTADQLANFSTGLFGGQLGIDGYFDPDTRAGFSIAEYPNTSGMTDTLTSGAILPSDYPSVPPVIGATANQFGDWLPNTMLPFGIFYDDDGNPDTDAELVAWYGVNATGLGWMTGAAGNFSDVSNAMIDTWSNDPLYFMGEIDDLVNVGLNYIVTVGDISAVSSNFTIRITPVIADNPTALPTYAGMTPNPLLSYTSSDAVISIEPNPNFVPGSLLSARVLDADGNTTTDPDVVQVSVSAPGLVTQNIDLEELGDDRGAFAGNLPDEFSNVPVGTTVTIAYDDGVNGIVTATSTAAASLPAGNVQFNPASYSVAEEGGNIVVTVERIVSSVGVLTVDYQTESGTAVGNEDYVPDAGTLVFADSETSKTITITILDDAAVESDQSFSIRLSGIQSEQGGAAIVGTNPATVTITDTDVAPTPPPASDSSDGLFGFSWITLWLFGLGLLLRRRSR